MHRRPRHHRPQAPKTSKAPPAKPLASLLDECPELRAADRGPLPREFWKALDEKHAPRPDYLLWRVVLSGGPAPAGLREDAAALALRALTSPDPCVALGALVLLPGLKIEQVPPQRLAVLPAALMKMRVPSGQRLAHWLAAGKAGGTTAPEGALRLAELEEILRTDPSWKPGRAPDPGFLASAMSPVPAAKAARWLAAQIHSETRRLRQNAETLAAQADWHLTTWLLLRDSRPAHAPALPAEVEALLNAASASRLNNRPLEAARWTALALHLLPPRVPEILLQRARVAAWSLAEAGIEAPAGLGVSLDDLPFPGENPGTPKGREVAALFHDPEDASLACLARATANDPDWSSLAAAGVELHHPLAALAWAARKAQSHHLKKQHALLDAAARLAARHHCLGSQGKILAQWPGGATAVLDYARALRLSLRQMPYLRDAAAWERMTSCLRAAWGRLEPEAITDPEDVFFIHETLLDREVTTLRRLPHALRGNALRHPHSRRAPSALVRELASEPKLLRQLEHQRRLELWEIAAALRERAGLANTVWVSLASVGEPGCGRFSLLVLGREGRRHIMGRLRSGTDGLPDMAPLAAEIARSIRIAAPDASWVLLAADSGWQRIPWTGLFHQEGLDVMIALLPGWEWAFRVMREPGLEQPPPARVLLPENMPPPEAVPALPAGKDSSHACLLLSGAEMCDASTRWHPLPAQEQEKPLYSLSLGSHPLVISMSVLKPGSLRDDLVRQCLAQSTLRVLAPARPLTKDEAALYETHAAGGDPAAPLESRLLRALPDAWLLHGLPSLCEH